MKVRRFDIGTPTLSAPVREANGWLRLDGHLTRSGVFEYRQADGSVRREYRPPEEVFAADSLRSFSLVPLTNGHPDEPLTAENTARYQVGTIGEAVERDGNLVRARVLVSDAAAVKAVDAGRQFLSCGYEAELDLSPGVSPEGERYDGVQRSIRGNHVALVDVPRAGPMARVRLDAADAVQIASMESESATPIEALMTTKIKLDGVEVEVPKTVASAFEAALKTATDAAEAAKARADSLDADLVKVRAELAEAPAKAAVAARARVELETAAREVLGAEAKFDGKTDVAVKAEVLAALAPKFDIDGKPDAYVDAAFDLRLAQHRAESPAALVAAAPRADASDALAKARAAHNEALVNAHKRKA